MSRASLRSNPRLRGRGRHRSPWNPRRLAPRAWYDAELGQPKYVGYVQLNGGSTDNISVPDSAFNSFSNDIEVIMRVRPDDWTTGAIQTLCGKYLTTGNQRSWRFYISSTGTIGLTASADGTAVTTIIVTPTTPFVDATWIWLRLRLDLTNGANSVGTVDIATDTGNNYTVPTSWTANGTNTGTTLAGIYNGTGVVEIGAFNSGTSERLAGRVGRCIVKAGFDGVVTSDFNADNCYGPGYSSVTTLPVDTNGYSHVPLSGVTGDYIYTADKASLDIIGDFELVLNLTLDDWTPSAAASFLTKWRSSGSQQAWALGINTSGQPVLYTSADGAATSSATSTAALTTSNGVNAWLKATRRSSDGRVQFFVADSNNLTEPSNWFQLGSDRTGVIGDLFSGTAELTIGANHGGASPSTGKIYRAIVRNGIDGTTVADYNASLSTVDGQVDAYGNQWIINQSKYLGTWTLGIPKIYDRSGNNVAPAVFGSGTNQPLWLPWKGQAQVYLVPSATSPISGDDTGAFDITDDLDIRFDLTLRTLPGSNAVVAIRAGSYAISVLTTGALRFTIPAVYDSNSAVFLTSLLGLNVQIRVTRTRSSGDVSFYYRIDGNLSATTGWILVTTNTGLSTAAIATNNAALTLGSSVFDGDLRRALLYNNGVLVAEFDAAQCSQSGYTDVLGTPWTIQRPTTGRKAVVQSGAAKSARSVILLGTDDYIDVPNAAIPSVTPYSFLHSSRRFATQVASNRSLSNRALSTTVGHTISINANGGPATVVQDGVSNTATANVTAALGQRAVVLSMRETLLVTTNVNAVAVATAATALGASHGGTGYLIGANPGPGNLADMEFESLITVDDAVSAIDHSRAVEYYNGGL